MTNGQRCPEPIQVNVNAAAVLAFLDHLEVECHNGPRIRNARLTAIRSLFIYASLRHPEHAGSISQVPAIPPKGFDKAIVAYLDQDEATALLAAPDRSTWVGRRDYTLISVAIQTGLRKRPDFNQARPELQRPPPSPRAMMSR